MPDALCGQGIAAVRYHFVQRATSGQILAAVRHAGIVQRAAPGQHRRGETGAGQAAVRRRISALPAYRVSARGLAQAPVGDAAAAQPEGHLHLGRGALAAHGGGRRRPRRAPRLPVQWRPLRLRRPVQRAAPGPLWRRARRLPHAAADRRFHALEPRARPAARLPHERVVRALARGPEGVGAHRQPLPQHHAPGGAVARGRRPQRAR